jgi:thiol-disulfide isomerase/thioredoxin
VSLDESADDLRQVLADQGISWPVAFEGKRWDNSLAALYRVYQIPTTYLLDRNGVIRYRDLEGEDLAKAVAELINEPAQTTSSGASALPELSAKAEPILEITVPKETGLRPGEESSLSLRITNASPYLAEEIRFSVQGLPAGIVSKTPDIFDLPAFGERTISLTFLAPKLEPKDFPIPIKVRVEYHYCIAEACFQMVQEAETTLVFGGEQSERFCPSLVGFDFVGHGGARDLAHLGPGSFRFFGVYLCLGRGYFGVRGLSWAGPPGAAHRRRPLHILCGIEEPHPSQAELSSELRLAFAALPKASHLVLFYTPWCRACPYAKNLVTEIAQINPKISVEMVDADSERERAEKAGVVVNGKAVVPAILIEETGRVLFGTNDLATRLLSALKEIP